MNKHNEPKILKKCSLPLTGEQVVNRIITDRAVMDVEENELVLVEVAEGWTVEEVIASTEAELKISDYLQTGAY